jgi:hypothetical protein
MKTTMNIVRKRLGKKKKWVKHTEAY